VLLPTGRRWWRVRGCDARMVGSLKLELGAWVWGCEIAETNRTCRDIAFGKSYLYLVGTRKACE
jgi:hypothetical protein